MSTDPRYSTEVLRRLRTTPGVGAAPRDAPFASGRAGDREQGAEVQFEFAVRSGLVAGAWFRAFGCPHLIAAASWLTERLLGASRADLLAWDWREAAAALAVPPAKYGRLLTLQDAVRDAAGNWPVTPGSTV